MDLYEAIEIICKDYCKYPDIESGNKLADICDKCPMNKCEDLRWAEQTEPKTQMKTQNSNLTFEKADEPQTDEEYINSLPWTEVGNGEQTDEPQTEEHCETCKHKDKCEGATYEYKNTEWWCLGYAPIEDEPQTDDFKACVKGLTLLWIYNYVTDDEFHRIDARLKCKGEPQTENLFTDKDGDVWEWRGDAWYCISGDEPQTERSE